MAKVPIVDHVGMGGIGGLLDFLLPLRCPACHRGRSAGLCEECTEEAGELLLPDLGRAALGPGVVAIGAFGYAGPIAAAIKTLKHPGRHGATGALSRLMWQVIDSEVSLRDIPRTWVPSSPAAMRSRGVEIPRLLAGDAAESLLVCPSDRPDQTVLDAEGRRGNVTGAFVAHRRVPETVVCVDDVRTTGATLLAAASALRAAGARRVVGVTLAVAGGDAL